MTDDTDRCLLMRQWRDRPDATLAVADVCRRVSRATNRSALAALQALLDEALLERAGGGVRPTAAGRELLAAMAERPIYPFGDGPGAGAADKAVVRDGVAELGQRQSG